MGPYHPPKVDPLDTGKSGHAKFLNEGVPSFNPKEKIQNAARKLRPSLPTSQLHPIIIVPGYSGMSLDVKRQNEPQPSKLWLNPWFLSPMRSNAYVQQFYDELSMKVEEREEGLFYCPAAANVEVTPTEYMGSGSGGGTYGCDYILRRMAGIGVVPYMSPVIASLEGLGYERNKNIKSANYDWRVSPDHLENFTTFSEDLRELIERTSIDNGGRPVIMLAHSMGNLILCRFLNSMSPDWREKYIRHFISVAAPWAGVPKTIRDILSGDCISDNLYTSHFQTFERKRVHRLAQSFGSLVFMHPGVEIWGKFPLVRCGDKDYDASQLEELYRERCSLTGAATIRKRTAEMLETLRPPQVPLTCFMGKGVRTERRWIYNEPPTDGQWPDEVKLKESKFTEERRYWEDEYKELNGGEKVKVETFEGQTHIGILSSKKFLDHLDDLMDVIHKV
ncbi:Lecithin:cholesterol acyltransferase family protein [Planoprotostelium fungivorum]|uniref:Lecithin:cholesterol acyltransferase family protein n=1 Tax=Planoprotostelium fungivorum TaxID=1890364 RepID=A0A2P6NDI6_9EUKA|nr:Lecithin:cholesterol acyltransferase family protein [Planoprotostelium fungivorum]